MIASERLYPIRRPMAAALAGAAVANGHPCQQPASRDDLLIAIKALIDAHAAG